MLRSDSPEAHTLLMRRYGKVLFNYGRKFSSDPDFIKDCVQDVFVSIWTSRSTISQTASIKSYLLKSLRQRIFKEHTKWRNLGLDESCEFEAELNIEEKLIEEQFLFDLQLRMRRVIAGLPRRQREILYLHFYEELKHEEMAEVMGLSKQSLYNLLHQAVASLRRAWINEPSRAG